MLVLLHFFSLYKPILRHFHPFNPKVYTFFKISRTKTEFKTFIVIGRV